jgi:predicted NUDIX family NTP pyrophosphohydrolase
MAAKTSAGILLYRLRDTWEVLLVHPGGPFWARKDEGAWFIVKGEVEAEEELLPAAEREFREELGVEAPSGERTSLGSLKNKSGKLIHAWAIEGDLDVSTIRSNTCHIEWPPRSGKRIEIPEVDRAEFFPLETAVQKMSPAEQEFLRRLALHLAQRTAG